MALALRVLAAAFVVALSVPWEIGTAQAQDATGGSLMSLQRAAADVRQGAASSGLDGNEQLRASLEQRNRERLINTLSAIAVAIIAREPQRRDEVLSAAEGAAPEVAGQVRARVLAAFPGAADAEPPRRQLPAGAGEAGAVGSPPQRGRGHASNGPALADAALVARRRDEADADYAARLEAWLVGAIARDPASLESHVSAAVSAMPEARERMVAAASRAFPGYSERVASAAGASRPESRQTTIASASQTPEAAVETPAAEANVVGPETQWDPLETMNRFVDSANQAVDFMLLQPVASFYSTFAPDPVILAMRRFFENLRQPLVVANDLLQFTFEDAATAAGRFGVNTTIGLLGLFDPATGMGLESHYADFGQTLHSYGVGPGPYLVLPLLGPSTVRDGIGEAVDIVMEPYGYFLPQTASLALTGTKAVVKREQVLAPLDELKASSVDYYAGLRSAYYQHRAIQLNKGRGMLAAPDVETDRMFDEAR